MKRKFLVAVIGVGSFVLYLTGCSKASEDKLSGGNNTCDTTNVKYSTQVVAILQANCYECHQGAGAANSGIDLGNYTKFKVHVDNGDVESAVTHTGNVTPMPYLRPKLPDCEVNTIVAWIHQGAQNN